MSCFVMHREGQAATTDVGGELPLTCYSPVGGQLVCVMIYMRIALRC